MKKIVTSLFTLALCAGLAGAAYAGAVRISQVYSGGGSSQAATYTTDYIELFNSSGSAVDISNWALEYGSATGNWGSSAGNYLVFPAGASIAPCSYLLVVTGTAGTGGAPIPISADYTGTMNLGAANGKVGLFNALNSNLACGSEIAGTLVDKVAWGTANCAEGTAVAALSITTGAVRNGGGMTDTDNNVADFTVVTNPVPRNSSSSANPDCLSTPTSSQTWGKIKVLYR